MIILKLKILPTNDTIGHTIISHAVTRTNPISDCISKEAIAYIIKIVKHLRNNDAHMR